MTSTERTSYMKRAFLLISICTPSWRWPKSIRNFLIKEVEKELEIKINNFDLVDYRSNRPKFFYGPSTKKPIAIKHEIIIHGPDVTEINPFRDDSAFILIDYQPSNDNFLVQV